MDIGVLNKSFGRIAVIDAFESFIWTDRYNSFGDFEIYSPLTDAIRDIMVDDYIQIKESEHLMIVERYEIQTDEESGNHVIITGRSLESILSRRIAWGQTILSGNFQNEIERLLNENVISPAISERQISNFVFERSSDPRITGLEIEAQYFGEDLYSIIADLCQEERIGFKIILNSSNQFVFSFYVGTDRSFGQNDVPYVIFSPNFENLLNTSYILDFSDFKTNVLVGGEGEGDQRRLTSVEYPDYTGLYRREVFVDAGEISSNEGEITAEEYDAQMEQRGIVELYSLDANPEFNGTLDTTLSFKYGTDFYMGDVVQVENEYGMQSKCRVVEMIMSEDGEGIKAYPTFESEPSHEPVSSENVN